MVGALVVRDETVLGEGWHDECGGPHAEVSAIADAGDADLTGATLYVSMEPCCHQGKTPPCTDAILAAGIARVVVACDDPSAKASGRGLGILRDEGVEVDVADGEVAARARLRQPGVSQARADRAPLDRLQVRDDARRQGRDADRRLAVDLRRVQPRPGASLARLRRRRRGRHRHRARRRPPAHRPRRERPPPASATSSSMPPAACRWTQSSSRRRPSRRSPSSSRAPRGRSDVEALRMAGAEVVVATGENEPARVRSALDQLGHRGVTSILLEGGPHLAGAFLDAGEIDEVAALPRAAAARRAGGARSARGRGRRADLRGPAGAHAGLRARRERPAHLGPAARVVSAAGARPDAPRR